MLYGFFLVFSATTHAQTKKIEAIDEEYTKCLAKDTSCGNIETCAFVAYGKWNKEMESSYNKVLKSLKKSKDLAPFKQSQTAWKAFRDAEFKSFDNMFNLPGSKWCLERRNARLEIVRARTLQLRSYLASFKK